MQVILCIVGLAILVVSSLLIVLFKSKSVKHVKINENEVILYSPTLNVKLFNIVYLVSILGLITLLVLSLLEILASLDFWMYFALLIVLGLMSIKYFSDAYYSYVKLGKSIIVHPTLFKERTIEYHHIKKSQFQGQSICLLDGQGKNVLSFVFNTKGAKESVNLLSGKGIKFDKNILDYYSVKEEHIENNKVNKEDSLEVVQTNKIEVCEMLGKAFRDNKSKYMKQDIIIAICIQLIILAIVITLTIVNQNIIFLFLLLINVYFGYSKVKSLKKKYNFDSLTDVQIGEKYAYLNKDVIGHHANKNRVVKTPLIMISILVGMILSFYGYSILTSKPISYDSMDSVSGNLISLKVNTQIEIKITSTNEYHEKYTFYVPNALNNYIKTDELVLEETNQEIEIKTIFNNNSYNANIYYLKIGDKVYIDENCLNSYYVDYMNSQKVTFVIVLIFGVLVIGGLSGYYIYNNTQKQKETISLSD